MWISINGKQCDDSHDYDTNDANDSIYARCSPAHNNHENYLSLPHDFLGAKFLQELFPYPSVYSRFTAHEAKKFGENLVEKIEYESGK